MEYMHRRKTGALIKAAVLSAAVLCSAGDSETDALQRYADSLGVAFQIRDDLLDVMSTDEELGKPIGSDLKNKKSTYVSLLGISGAENALAAAVAAASSALDVFEGKALFLEQLAHFVATRKK
jgi:geranylgeranyl diphosphate synthase type II